MFRSFVTFVSLGLVCTGCLTTLPLVADETLTPIASAKGRCHSLREFTVAPKEGGCVVTWNDGNSEPFDQLDIVGRVFESDDLSQAVPVYMARRGDQWYFAHGSALGDPYVNVRAGNGYWLADTETFDDGKTATYVFSNDEGWSREELKKEEIISNLLVVTSKKEDHTYVYCQGNKFGPFDSIESLKERNRVLLLVAHYSSGEDATIPIPLNDG